MVNIIRCSVHVYCWIKRSLVFTSTMPPGHCAGNVEERLRLPGLAAGFNSVKVGRMVDYGRICCGSCQV